MIGNYIKAVATAVSRTTAQLMKTGQTTSYYTNDDGQLQIGRSVNFTTLAENNPFGNTSRFTDTLGLQTYSNAVVIDWSTFNGSTVLGWSRTYTTEGINWNNLMNQQSRTIGGFTNFRMPNITQLCSIINYQNARVLNYAPFNFDNTHSFATSTTQALATGNAYFLSNQGGAITAIAKTTLITGGSFVCRVFTVTGTTLS